MNIVKFCSIWINELPNSNIPVDLIPKLTNLIEYIRHVNNNNNIKLHIFTDYLTLNLNDYNELNDISGLKIHDIRKLKLISCNYYLNRLLNFDIGIYIRIDIIKILLQLYFESLYTNVKYVIYTDIDFITHDSNDLDQNNLLCDNNLFELNSSDLIKYSYNLLEKFGYVMAENCEKSGFEMCENSFFIANIKNENYVKCLKYVFIDLMIPILYHMINFNYDLLDGMQKRNFIMQTKYNVCVEFVYLFYGVFHLFTNLFTNDIQLMWKPPYEKKLKFSKIVKLHETYDKMYNCSKFTNYITFYQKCKQNNDDDYNVYFEYISVLIKNILLHDADFINFGSEIYELLGTLTIPVIRVKMAKSKFDKYMLNVQPFCNYYNFSSE